MNPARSLLMAVLLSSCMCGRQLPAGPRLHALAPAQVLAGYSGTLAVAGEGLLPRVQADFDRPGASASDATFQARLVGTSATLALADVRWVSDTALELAAPPGLVPGEYTLEVVDPYGRSASLPAALQVLPECHGDEECRSPPGTCSGSTGTCEAWRCRYPPLPLDTPCDDGLLCSVGSACDGAGACVARQVLSCVPPGGDPVCWLPATCAEPSGTCHFIPRPAHEASSTCDDGQACTLADRCDGAGDCTGTPRDCSAPPPVGHAICWQPGECSEAAGGTCVHAPVPAEPPAGCTDGLACTEEDTCDGAGTCLGTPRACTTPPGGDPVCWQAGECREPDGSCHYLPKPESPPAACSDGKTCTTGDSCDGAGGCRSGAPRVCPAPPNALCFEPAVSCVEGLGCQPVVMTGGTCADDNACLGAGTCAADGSGACVGRTPLSGAPCDDGNACTLDGTQAGGDACVGGRCVGGAPVADATPCDDGNACTQDEACGAGTCTGGTPLTGTACDDGDPCTRDSCGAGACVGTFDASLPGCALPPVACLTLTPTSGSPQGEADPTVFVADASCSTGGAGGLEYRFDWGGDGWDTSFQSSPLATRILPAVAGSALRAVVVEVRQRAAPHASASTQGWVAVAPSTRTLVVTSARIDERDTDAPGFSLTTPLGTGLSLAEAIDHVNRTPAMQGALIRFAPELSVLEGDALNDTIIHPLPAPPTPNTLALSRQGVTVMGRPGLTLDFSASTRGLACLEVAGEAVQVVGLTLTSCDAQLIDLWGPTARVMECTFSPGARRSAEGLKAQPDKASTRPVFVGPGNVFTGFGKRGGSAALHVKGSQVVVEGNRFYDNASTVIAVYNPNASIRGNLFHDNRLRLDDTTAVVLVKNNAPGTHLLHNTFHANTGHAIVFTHLDATPANLVRNNLFSRQGGDALRADPSAFLAVDGREPNGYFGTGGTFGPGQGSPDPLRSVVGQDPLLTDPDNPALLQRSFRLQHASPMVNRGEDLGVTLQPDLNGALPGRYHPEPGGRPDLGALESPF